MDLKKHLLEHPRHKRIKFYEQEHKYEYFPDLRKNEGDRFNGITGWISSYSKKKFKPKEVAKSCNANPNSKYYNWGEQEILDHWKQKQVNGSNIHKSIENVVNEGIYDEEFAFYIDRFWEVMDQEGIEPFISELVVYDESIERATAIDICGIRKETGKLVPMDIKTYEDGMEFSAYNNETFKHPLGTLPDSKYSKVSLQVSIERKWLTELYGVPFEQTEDGLVLVLNDDGCKALPVMNYIEDVNKMYEYG